MQPHWLRILAWVKSNAPNLLDALKPPADRADLAEAEQRLSMRLPTALRTFYGLQNGTTSFSIFPALEADQSAFGPLPLDEVDFFEIEEEDADPNGPAETFDVDPGVRPEFWNEQWIPLAGATDRGDLLMLDFAPARGGKMGQVIEWRHDTNERRVVAPSLEAFLKQLADAMEAGRVMWDEVLGARRESTH